MRTTVVLVPTRNQSWNVGSVARLVTSKGIVVVVDAITWWIDSGATTHVYESDKYILSKSDSVYMSSSTIVNSSLWHARLGHVHYKRMLEMSKDDLIPAIDENSKKYTTCLSEGFWEEAMAIVRLPDPKMKTLGEKGIDCIFVGYVEHSKAYRFYVIKPNDSVSINSIIELKDAIFDENRFSLIPRPKDIIPNLNEFQRDDHLNDVTSEIPEP
ncbi:zinc finger, CCHC-type containing protein, partial [Tanacetum coccineum]